MDIYNKFSDSGEERKKTAESQTIKCHATTNTICIRQCRLQKCHFKRVFVGYCGNKSAVQHVLLNWILLRHREREGEKERDRVKERKIARERETEQV